MLNLFKRAIRNASTIVWAVTLNHILWGWYFITHELPLPFGGIHAFSDPGMQDVWGYTFITVALLSVASDFMRGLWGTVLLIPQQLVVLYGFTGMVTTLIDAPTQRLILAACWVFPLALTHSIAVLTRYSREHHSEFAERMKNLLDE